MVVPANSSVQLGSTFTLALVDAGPVGSDQSGGQTRHWLVNGATSESSGGVCHPFLFTLRDNVIYSLYRSSPSPRLPVFPLQITPVLLPQQEAAIIGEAFFKIFCDDTTVYPYNHSYVFLLYAQPATFTAPEGLSEPNIGVSVFSLPEYVAVSAQY